VQHGPLQVSQKLNKTGVYQYTVAPADDGTTLTEIGDVLYLDQPVGTGFSYGANDTDLLTSMEDISREFVNFVDSFLNMYPEYKSPRKVILMGESSAGKFFPPIVKALDAYIQIGNPLTLQAVVLGNAFQAGVLQRLFSYKPAKGLSLIDAFSNIDQATRIRDKCLETFSEDGAESNEVYKNCTKLLAYITDVSGQVASFDGRKYSFEWDAMMAPFQGYLGNNTAADDLYKALHVENSTKSQKWTYWNMAVLDAVSDDSIVDYTQWYDWMQAHGYKLLIYVGEWDLRDGPATMEPWMRNSKYLNPEIWEDSRKIYYVNDTYAKRMKVGGYWRNDPKSLVTLFTLPKAGHSALRGDVVTLMSLIGDYMTPNSKGLQCHA
jgi:carboxypeptidase C (cathepsin A)